MQVLATGSEDRVALKNPGEILGKEGDSLMMPYYLRMSYQIDPQNPQTVYVLAYAYLMSDYVGHVHRHSRRCWG